MHEWALAQGVISTAVKVAKERNSSRILSVRIKLGELQQIEEEILISALQELSKNTSAEGAEFLLTREQAVLQCNRCFHQWVLDRSKFGSEEAELIHFLPEAVHAYARCPRCGSPDFTIKSGRGVWIESVELE